MNKKWSEYNKKMQKQIAKKDEFNNGIETLLILRNELLNEIRSYKNVLSKDDFSAIPFINANGYHSKTIAYSLYHIFRIEDIVSNTLIKNSEQIFFKENYQYKINSPIITTGNELYKQEIAEFSQKLAIDELYKYIENVNSSSEVLLNSLSYADIKTKINLENQSNLRLLNCVSDDEKAQGLIDYWCSKDIKGLIQMLFSRHWIMHIEACIRIKNKILE